MTTSRRDRARRYAVGFLVAGLFMVAVPAAKAYPDCQYRMWDSGEHFTFHDEDWFLAAGAYAFPYKLEGITRDEAIAELDKYSDRLWLAQLLPGTRKAIGPLIEQQLSLTAYSDAVHPEDGLLVIRQEGAILHLPAGDYLSINEVSYDGSVVWRSRVILHIVPSDTAECSYGDALAVFNAFPAIHLHYPLDENV